MKLLIFIITASLLICACKQNVNEKEYPSKSCEHATGFVIDTPKVGYINHTTIENNRYLTLRQMNIPSDTFFLRIESGSDAEVKIFEYSLYKEQASFKVYRFPVDRESQRILFNKEKDDLRNFVTVFDPAKNGSDFLAQLQSNSILELPDSRSIPGYGIDHMGKWITVIYSNKCMYKILGFNNPYGHINDFKEAKSLATFLGYLKQAFNF